MLINYGYILLHFKINVNRKQKKIARKKNKTIGSSVVLFFVGLILLCFEPVFYFTFTLFTAEYAPLIVFPPEVV